MENGKITDLDGLARRNTITTTFEQPKTPKKSHKTGNRKISNGSGKKRTAEEMEGEESAPKAKEESVVSAMDEADAGDDG